MPATFDGWRIRRGADPLSVFVAVLGHSRAAYAEFVTDERLESLLACHEAAFAAFGGTPREALYDNMRTVVVERDRYGHGQHRFHPGFLDFAGHCGFRPRLCRPYRAQSKGKVERFIRYLRGGFWVPLVSRMAADGVVVNQAAANLAVGRWLREVANARVHATTDEVPAARLEVERGALGPIPPPYMAALVSRPATEPRTAPRAPARLPTPALAATAAAAIAARAGEAAAASPVDPGRRCSTCLVVEDEAMIRMLVCELLAEAGFAVAEAGDADAALGALHAAPADQPCVLVTDINLGPGADGLALAAAARRLRPGLRVVYVTANPDRVPARRGGPDDRIVAKPFDAEALVRTVVDAAAAVAGRPRSEQ